MVREKGIPPTSGLPFDVMPDRLDGQHKIYTTGSPSFA
jgi:hypothetical protein